jgi:CheY-like chemotaxis protein
MQALGQLTGGIAHDFNNLLQVIASGVRLLGTPELSEKRRELVLGGMAQAIENGKQLVDRMLAFARRKPLRPQAFDLNARLGGMSELLRRALGSRIRVKTDFAPDLWPVVADPVQLETAVLNLAVNARDAMPRGGTLTLRTRNTPLDATADRPAGAFVCLVVEDTGQGMTPGVLARVFEPFFTTKPVGEGTGLGLPQVHGFAKQSGGDVHVESVPGAGTKVVIHLPRATVVEREVGAAEDAAAPEATEPGRVVLVVEDNAQVASLTATMLEELGHAARLAGSAAEAMAVLEAGEPVDAVFSDIVMPGEVDGLGLAGLLRGRFPSLAVVLTTGYSDALARGRDAAAEVLPKPYGPDELAAALARAFGAVGSGAGATLARATP